MKPLPQASCRLARWTAFSAVILLVFLLLRPFAPRLSSPGGTQPVASESPSPALPAPPAFSPDSCITYIAQPGDTLLTLSELFSTGIPLLSSANPGFSPDTPLPPGTVILIPPSP